MTLTLTKVSANYVLQVSDRLVTLRSSGEQHDAFANKNIIYTAKDGIVVIAYAGLAYLDLVPTDEWIAEKLWDKPFEYIDGHPVALQLGAKPKDIRLGPALHRLCGELQQALRRLSGKDVSFELTAAGWELKHGDFLPACFTGKYRQTGELKLERMRIPWHRTHIISTISIGAQVTTEENEAVKRCVSTTRKTLKKHIDATEVCFMETIRNVATRKETEGEPTVGRNCMSVLVPRPDTAAIRVRFIPEAEHTLLLKSRHRIHELPIVFSPWIIGTRSVSAPATISGAGGGLTSGRMSVEIEGPSRSASKTPKQNQAISIHYSQRRKPPP